MKNFQKNPNKLNYVYVLTPKGVAEKTKLTINFMKRKMKEYDELKSELKKQLTALQKELVPHEEAKIPQLIKIIGYVKKKIFITKIYNNFFYLYFGF